MIDRITARLPSLHASVRRVYGPDAQLFGIDLARGNFDLLCDECGVGPYERNQPLTWDGLKILPGPTLDGDAINAVVDVPGSLIVRPTTLDAPDS